MLSNSQIISIERDLTQISLEANVLSNMINTLKNVFPNLIEKLRESFNKTDHLPSIEIKLTKEQQFVVKNINDYKFIDIAELGVNTPEGFTGTYIDYCKVLLIAIERISNIESKVLQPYSIYLSSFLTNKDAKIDTRSQTKVYNELKNTRDHLVHDLSKFIKDSNHNSVSTIGHVFKRNSDFKTTYEEVAKIKKKIDLINIKTINESVKKCLDLIDMIIEKIEKGEIENVSPEVTLNLSNGAYEIAKEVEFFSVVYFGVLSLVTCVDYTTVKLSNFIQNIPD